ncbi:MULTISPECIES: anti-sigma factor [Sphingobacterium]|uniref:anti-sigma factor n=1 Tax=Sphingobacterium TaxID=28453 RepID=UPI002580668B|nr:MULTISPECIES: anti-sigma factor [Sphingobacterium]
MLGLASEEEVSILNCIRKNNSAVDEAVIEAEKMLENLAEIQAVAMPISLKEKIWARLEDENLVAKNDSADLPPTLITSSDEYDKSLKNSSTEEQTAQIVSLRSYGWAIAASVLLALSAGANLFFYLQQQQDRQMLAQTDTQLNSKQTTLAVLQDKWALIQNPAIKTISLKGVETKPDLHALVYWDQHSKAVYLSLDHMPVPPKGKQYQLWAMVDGQPVSVGVFPVAARNQMASKMLDVAKAQAFVITLEDEGGKPSPTLTELCVMGNI